MNPQRLSARMALGLAVSTLALAFPALAQSPTESFHKAYYLEHESGDLQGALALYEQVAGNRRAPAELRQKAAAYARGVTEELACSDFAQLIPADAIFYLEFNRPGEQLRSLLEQLGLLGGDGARYGISPALLDGALGMRGAAIAITEIDPRRGPTAGVAILHPGDLDVVRGLLETALPVGGKPEAPIGDHATYSIEGEAFVTLTSRLMIAGRNRADVAGVIDRIHNGGEGSLAHNRQMAGAMAMRGSDLMFCCLNLEPVMPMIMDAIRRETRREPGVAAALMFFDLPSARTIVARAGVDESGMSFDMMLELDEGHRNLAFNLMRMPNLDREAMSLVPAGAAAFAIGAVNGPGSTPASLKDAKGRPVVTAMDFGRELFANLGTVAAFVMPDVERAPWGPMPDVGLAMRVNDPERSVALWQFLLGTAQKATGGQPGVVRRRGDIVVKRYTIDEVPVFLAHAGNHLVVSPSERLIGTAVEAARSGESVLHDPVFAPALAHLADGSTKMMAANLGRCSEIGRHFMSERERREFEPFAGLMHDTTVSFGVMQTSNRLGVHGCVVGIPDVGPMISDLIDREMNRDRRRAISQRSGPPVSQRSGPPVSQRSGPPVSQRSGPPVSQRSAPRATRAVTRGAPRPAVVEAAAAPTADDLRADFENANGAGRIEAASKLAAAYGAAVADNPMLVNNFAWALLTEEQYGNRYDRIARRLSKTSNEAADWKNWYYLDTYARALFQTGSIDEAIKMQRKAIEVGAEDPRIGEARQSLERYVAAAKKGKIR